MNTEQIIEEYFTKLKLRNANEDVNGMADLMLELQTYLIEQGVITEDIKPAHRSNESAIAKEIADIFLDIRREFQRDEDPISDFGYLLVADNWLILHGITPAVD